MGNRRLGIAIAVALLGAAGVGAACSVEDVIVAQDFAGGAGGPCSDSVDCLPVEFCSKTSCTAPRGRCEIRPVDCDDQQQTTCGCDGVNYWNDCLRRQNAVAAGTGTECAVLLTPCGGFRGTPCPEGGARCARIVPGPGDVCDPGVPGVCWMLPQRCPADDGGSLWETCGSRPPMCTSFCEAIHAERPFRMASSPTCQ
jgi:hypothetical protein